MLLRVNKEKLFFSQLKTSISSEQISDEIKSKLGIFL